MPYQQVHRPVSSAKRKDTLRLHRQADTLLSNQKGRRDRLFGGPQGFPEAYAAPRGWYKGCYEIKLEINLPPEVLEDMHEYYADLFSQYKDVLTALEVCKITGYSKTAVNNWCANGNLKSFKRYNVNHIPKIYLIEFFCSPYCRSVTRKSDWHIRTLKHFPSWRSQKQSQGGAK